MVLWWRPKSCVINPITYWYHCCISLWILNLFIHKILQTHKTCFASSQNIWWEILFLQFFLQKFEKREFSLLCPSPTSGVLSPFSGPMFSLCIVQWCTQWQMTMKLKIWTNSASFASVFHTVRAHSRWCGLIHYEWALVYFHGYYGSFGVV